MAVNLINASTPSIGSFKGVGLQTLKNLEKLGIRSIQDLLFHLPLRYEDRTEITPLGALDPGSQVLLEASVEEAVIIPKGRRALVVRLSDGSGHLTLRFFHYTHDQYRRFSKGQWVRCYGEIREGFNGFEITHPDYQLIAESQRGQAEKTLTPVYPLTEGLHQKNLRRLILQAIDHLHVTDIEELLPAHLLKDSSQRLEDALRTLHSPPPGCHENSQTIQKAKARLAFEELLAHHLSLSQFRVQVQNHGAPQLCLAEASAQSFEKALPFKLTQAQRRVVLEILSDLQRSHPMMRLVQGDVGSGKTVVAAYGALAALGSNHQVAIMAPTELLAEQHARSFHQWLDPLGVRVVFLGGKSKGENRKKTLADIQSGEAGVVIGTHALFQDQVNFFSLGLIIIDEQHRFGVHQRLALREKGRRNDQIPHQLIMTATPIPRTLAMLGYADLDLSVIDERPPGRTPVKTVVLPTSRRGDIVERIAEWVEQKRQVYWVCTLIEESEALQAEAAENSAERLKELLPAVRIALVHGRLKSSEKEALMLAFKAGEIDLLVATTVIEVGVDVPNASLMVIENSERLGLSQLHQLRGRVGRGPGEAHCVLIYQPPLSLTARERLGILRDTDDGFVIAEKDLELRGPGELLGTRQTGQAQFKVADLVRDGHLMDRVHEVATTITQHHPDLIQPIIRRWLGDAVQYIEA